MSEEKIESNGTGGQINRIPRRHELDVLTTLIVFGLMFFHTASIFSGHQLITNNKQSTLTTILASLAVSSEFIWIMPVMMLVAGIAAWHSLERRTPTKFLRERLLRLGVPFLTGLILINPPQMYYYLRANAGLSAGFISFLPKHWNIRFSLLSFPYFLEPPGCLWARGAAALLCPAPDAHHRHRLLCCGTELAGVGQVLDHILRRADRNLAGL